MTPTGDGSGVDGDPFDNLRLDEEFVHSATVREPAASSRPRVLSLDAERRNREGERRERRRRQRWATVSGVARKALSLIVVVALVALAWRSAERSTPPIPAIAPHSDVLSSPARAITERPPAPTDERPDRILPTPPLPPEGGAYRFLAVQPRTGDPVAYDPCQPVHLVINARTAPPEGERLLREAVTRVSEATGLQLLVDGTSDEPPNPDRPVHQPDRYPGRWAPILVAWSDSAESPRLGGPVAGYGGSAWIESSQGAPSVFVTGAVTLDGPQMADMLDERGGFAAARRILLHEFGHLVGLDHVADESQIMNHVGSGEVSRYGDGDLTGLALVGRGQCFPGL